MKADIRWLEPMSFVGETGSGHAIVMDGAEEFGGRDLGPRPMEMLLLGLGGCTSFDVVLILKKARQQITDCRAEVSAERADTDPKVFTNIHVHFVITGHKLSETRVQKAIELSSEKYCSASIMLGATANVTHDFEIREACPEDNG